MRALIIGGGIGGLTAAIALRRKCIEAEVYERTPELGKVGAGIGFWPNAVKALQKLGLGEGLDSISLVNRDTVLRRWDGRILTRTSADDLKHRFAGNVIILHRAELQDLLSQSAGFANIRLGHECTGIDQDADGVTATFANGTSARGDVLIGADGLHSMVRAWLGHRDPPRYAGYVAWRAVVPFDSAEMLPCETWGCGRRFGMFPIQGRRVYWFAVNNSPESATDSPEGPRARLLSLFKGWHEPTEALIQAAGDSSILRNNIYDRDPLKEWGRGRVTLLGDAAHPMTPNLGQGACQAIEDALVLAAQLSGPSGAAEGLRNYESSRIPRTESVVLTSRRLGALGQIDSPFRCYLRDQLVRMIPGSLALRGMASVVGYEGHLADN
jgi:2-polyprenyl-6-methoxyphenol hydroxylase-like FAD-dependent oxidoreductase